MSIPIVLVALGVLGLVAAAILTALARRGARQAEIDAGLDVLRTLGWKEFAQFVARAFELRGFKAEGGMRKPGEDGVDLVMMRGNQRHLLQIKHGGAYLVGAQVVRRLTALVETQNAAGAIVVTSGRFDEPARAATRGQPVTLVDGEALWAQLQPVLPEHMMTESAARADERAQQSRKRNLAIGVASSVLAVAGAVGLALTGPGPATRDAASAPAPAVAPAATAPAEPQAPAATESVAAQGAESVNAMPRAARPPSEKEMAQHRDFAAAAALLVDGVISATWPSKSTLQIAVRAGTEDKRDVIVSAVCQELLRREDLRFTRLQIQDLTGTGGGGAATVRWRQCQ